MSRNISALNISWRRRKDGQLFEINGRGKVIRTPDPLLPKQVLYQAELCPDDFERSQCRTLPTRSSTDRVIAVPGPVPAVALNGEPFYLANAACSTLSPALRPSSRATPAASSSTATTLPCEAMMRSLNGSVFSSMRCTTPPLAMNTMSKGM